MKVPDDIPYKMAIASKLPRVLANGHAKVMMAAMEVKKTRIFTGPNRLATKPGPRRPKADEALTIETK